MESTSWVLGIDAGGTSVRVAVAPAGAAVPGDVPEAGRSASDADGGPQAATRLIGAALAEKGVPAASVRAVCAGITKFTRTGVAAAWESALAHTLPQSRVLVVPDYAIAFTGAISDSSGAGVTVIAGTGSVVYGENAAGVAAVRVGGRGWEFGDEGSGAWLTAEIVRRTLRLLDGIDTGPPSPLTKAVCDHLETTEPAALAEAARRRCETDGRGFLVPLALQFAQAGDTEARNLFVGAGGWLATQARAAARRLDVDPDDALTIATVGGLWEAGDLLREPFLNALQRWYPNAVVCSPNASPLTGAVRRAAFMR